MSWAPPDPARDTAIATLYPTMTGAAVAARLGISIHIVKAVVRRRGIAPKGKGYWRPPLAAVVQSVDGGAL